jgi:hypothetical protein
MINSKGSGARFLRLAFMTMGGAVVFSHHVASAQVGPALPPADAASVLQCRQVAAESARLACYDAVAAKLAQSQVRKEAAEFGLQQPAPKPQEDSLTGVIRSVAATRDGWVVTLEDGSTWRQEDASGSRLDPVVGRTVVIRRAALGSYRLMLNDNVGFKVRRVR